MEAVFAEAGSPRWFQLYIYKDGGITRELVQRAEAAGAEAGERVAGERVA